MGRIGIKIKNLLKKFFILLDYIFWMIFDFSKFKTIDKNRIKKVLIIHNGAIGELLAATPIAATIKNELSAEIHFMARKGPSGILANNPNIDRVLEYKDDFNSQLESFKKEKYDLAVILWPGSLKVSLTCLKADIPYRVGCFKMVKEGPAFFFTRRWLALKVDKQHAVESNAGMLKLIGLENRHPKMEVYASKKAINSINSFLKSKKTKNFAIIHPGFGQFSKNRDLSRFWPVERYSELADYLTQKKRLKVIITGTNEEAALAKEILEKSKNKKDIIITSGKFSLEEFVALISKSKLVVAPDTSAIHIAAALNVPLIDLVSRRPIEWHPWMPSGKYKMIFHPRDNWGTGCEDGSRECILAISSEEVESASNALLK